MQEALAVGCVEIKENITLATPFRVVVVSCFSPHCVFDQNENTSQSGFGWGIPQTHWSSRSILI
jgi:hypothetical protein